MQINPIYAAQVGEAADPTCASWLAWLLHPMTQGVFAGRGYGLPVCDEALDSPVACTPPGFARMAAAVRAAYAVLPLDEDLGLQAANEAVLDRLLVPALLGLAPAPAVLDQLVAQYLRACPAADDRHEQLRRILLAG